MPPDLRVGVKGGGCSGLSYNLTFETQARTGDKVFERDDVKLFCDLKSYIYLNGTVLDYDSGLMGKGIRLHESQRQEELRLRQLVLDLSRDSCVPSPTSHELLRSVRSAQILGIDSAGARKNVSRAEPQVSSGLLHNGVRRRKKR